MKDNYRLIVPTIICTFAVGGLFQLMGLEGFDIAVFSALPIYICLMAYFGDVY